MSPEPPTPSATPPALTESRDPHSSFRLEITLSVGYQRRRALLGGAWEGHVTTVVLLFGGAALVGLVILGLIHLLGLLPF